MHIKPSQETQVALGHPGGLIPNTDRDRGLPTRGRARPTVLGERAEAAATG